MSFWIFDWATGTGAPSSVVFLGLASGSKDALSVFVVLGAFFISVPFKASTVPSLNLHNRF